MSALSSVEALANAALLPIHIACVFDRDLHLLDDLVREPYAQLFAQRFT